MEALSEPIKPKNRKNKEETNKIGKYLSRIEFFNRKHWDRETDERKKKKMITLVSKPLPENLKYDMEQCNRTTESNQIINVQRGWRILIET